MKAKTFKAICWMFTLLLFGSMTIQAENLQSKTVTGNVLDNNQDPLIGVTVKIKNTNIATITDLDGSFSVSPTSFPTTLEFTYIGYASVEVVVTDTKPIKVKMKEDATLLKETVVIGYGITTKKELTGSVASLKTEDFNKGTFSDAMGLLQGKVAGLSIVRPGGANPQSTYEMILRGTNTLTSGQEPLVIIDGVVGESLRNINFEEIESVDVLKDGSAAAIYGTRGTNGVIIITTRRAKSGRATVEYSGQLSVQVAPRTVKNLTASQFTDAINKYVPSKSGNLYGADTDWLDQITRETPVSHHHSIAISGGTEAISHRTTFNIEQNEGLLKNNNFDKYLFKTNIKQKAFDNKLTLDMNATYSQRRYSPANTDLFYQAFIYNPTAPIYNSDGSYYSVPDPGTDYYNPVAMLKERSQKGKTNDFTGSVRATIELYEGLNWVNFFTYSNSDWENRSYKTRRYPSLGTRKGEAEIGNGNLQNKQYEMLLNYSKDFDKHRIQAVLGYAFQEVTSSNSSITNSDFDTDLYGTHNIGEGAALKDGNAAMGSYKERNNLIAFFGRAMYSYGERYLASVSLRREGSSRFGKNNKWGWFPAVSLGWRISEENFMKDAGLFNELKLRLGYGVTGNQSFPNYRSLALMSSKGKFYYNGEWVNSYAPSRNDEPNLKWEMKHEYNAGVDFSILDGRLGGTIDVYYRKVKDALYEYPVPVPPNLYPFKFTNVGELSNKGIEISINGVPVKSNQFEWNSSITFALNKNEFKRIANEDIKSKEIVTGWVGGDIAVNTQKLVAGQPVGTFYGPVWLGTNELGKDLFKNSNPVGDVDSKSWEKIGAAVPDYTIGWNNSFRYKRCDLSFALRASIGGDVLNRYRLYYENWSAIGKKNIIATQYKDTPNFEGTAFYSSKYVEDATYLKMDNISFGYDVPIRFKYISALRLSLTAQDVFCITKYKGLDPEVALSGVNPGIEPLSYYPRTTSITMGVNVTF